MRKEGLKTNYMKMRHIIKDKMNKALKEVRKTKTYKWKKIINLLIQAKTNEQLKEMIITVQYLTMKIEATKKNTS